MMIFDFRFKKETIESQGCYKSEIQDLKSKNFLWIIDLYHTTYMKKP